MKFKVLLVYSDVHINLKYLGVWNSMNLASALWILGRNVSITLATNVPLAILLFLADPSRSVRGQIETDDYADDRPIA